jgi:hypothetical protein
MASTSASGPKTRAWEALEQNLDSISHMITLGGREIALVNTATTRLMISVRKSPDLKVKTSAAKLRRSLERYNRTLDARLGRYRTVTLWQVVMLVTCVEAYLQDLLAIAASVDPELMDKSQQAAAYADVISATSLEELASELRARWARRWLGDGGPTRWISRLERMGARGYPDGLARRLELIWGIRHVVVHAAGVATADFVKRHPGVAAAAGDRVRVGIKDLQGFLAAAGAILEPTERFFVTRYPSLLAPTATKLIK